MSFKISMQVKQLRDAPISSVSFEKSHPNSAKQLTNRGDVNAQDTFESHSMLSQWHLGIADKSPGTCGTPPANRAEQAGSKEWKVSTGGLRNEEPLTEAQKAAALSYAKSLGVPEEAIVFSDNMNTSYKLIFGQERLYIGTDVLPAKGQGLRANSLIGMKGALAHEIVGHRAAELAGKSQTDPVLEEAQASIRAARFAPGLSKAERNILIRDAIDRLHNAGLSYCEVKKELWINSEK